MKHFTIDTDNNITVHSSKKAARETGAAVFSTEEQFAELIGPDNKRLVEIFNTLPGVKPVAKFANRKIATERIWKAIQSLGEAAAPVLEPEINEIPAETAPAAAPASEGNTDAIGTQTTVPEVPVDATEATSAELPIEDATPQTTSEPSGVPDQSAELAEHVPSVDAQTPDVAPAASEPSKQAGRAKKAPKVPKVAKAPQSESGPREGSKTAQVVAMLQRKNGATLTEIMEKMGWQKHTVRGFMAGTMKKAGFTVESFKPEGGERTYRINQ
jgi:hypothetical protein